MTVTIRPATASDVEELAKLRYEFRSSVAMPVEEREAFCARCTSWMRRRLVDGSGWYCWMAEAEGHAIGAVWLHVIDKVPNPVVEPEQHGYVTNFYVRDAYRGTGIGSRLLEAVLAWTRAHDLDSIILWPSARSRSLYERFGFSSETKLMELADVSARQLRSNPRLPPR